MTNPTDPVLMTIATTLAGYRLDVDASTGGGCVAHVVTAPDGRTCYLTDGDFGLPVENGQAITLGYFDADDELDGYLTIEADSYVGALADSLRAWAKDDPFRDVESHLELGLPLR